MKEELYWIFFFKCERNCAVKCIVTPKEVVRSQLEFGSLQKPKVSGKSRAETIASE